MAKTNTQPELRFAGFEEDWVEKKAKKLCSISTGKSNTQDNIKDGIYPFYVRSPIIERSNKFLFDEEAVLTVGDGVGTGKVHHYVNGKYDLHQRVYRMFDFKEVTGKYFYLFFSNNFHARVTAMTAKSSVDSVRLDMIAEMNIKYPEIDEQKLIGNFFENIDKLITEHQQKHIKLKALKQAMLDKMFPKQGQLVPEIRFKGFEGDWEEKKLSELSNYSNGKGYESFQSSSGKYELINLNSISIDGGLKPSGKFIEHADATLKQNDLVMVLSDVGHGDLLGRVALIPEDDKYVLNQRVALLRPNKEISPYFLYYNINANQLYFKTQGAGMSQLNLSKKSVEDFTSLIPKENDEQIAIADYFGNIDNLIVNHETQITKLQNIKKAFLAKMFI